MHTALRELMDIRNLPSQGQHDISGSDPVFSTSFRVAETGAAVLGAIGVAVSDIWELKTGHRQSSSIDVRAAGAAINSFAYLQLRQADGRFETLGNSPAATIAYQITQPWPTKDGRWFLPHFGIAHMKERVLGLLRCQATPESVAQAVGQWRGQVLEDAIAELGPCGAMVRKNAEWLSHPHGQALASRPVVEIEKIGDSDPEPFPSGGQPLAGIRVLDLTRILAGPVAARTCAEQGADVLMVAAKHAPQIKNFVIDLSPGKRSCFLDLKYWRRCRSAQNIGARRRCLLPRVPSGRSRDPRLWRGSIGGHAPWTHPSIDQLFWPARALPKPGRLGTGGPGHGGDLRWCRFRTPRPATGARLRLSHRLFRRLRNPPGIGATRGRGRQLSRQRLAVSVWHVLVPSGASRISPAGHGYVRRRNRAVKDGI